MPGVLVQLDKHAFKQLQELAKQDERNVMQQARLLLKRALRAAASPAPGPTPAPGGEASDA